MVSRGFPNRKPGNHLKQKNGRGGGGSQRNRTSWMVKGYQKGKQDAWRRWVGEGGGGSQNSNRPPVLDWRNGSRTLRHTTVDGRNPFRTTLKAMGHNWSLVFTSGNRILPGFLNGANWNSPPCTASSRETIRFFELNPSSSLADGP